MKLSMMHRVLLVPVLGLLVLSAGSSNIHAYVDGGHKWGTNFVRYYVNPRSIHVSESAAISAIQTAAASWSEQTRANIALGYAGTTNGSSITLNYKNEVFFRDAANGSAIAEAYYWWDGTGQLIDADIVFNEGGFTFFAGSGCSSGYYIEDAATHEFGHVLGLLHSSESGATMYPSMPGSCDRTMLTLEADDIAGIESMYPPTSASQPPSAPTQLSVATSGSSSLVLSWNDNANNEQGYRIEQSADSISFAEVAQVGANVASYTSSGLSAGATYYYRVAAYSNDGTSGYSNIAAGQTTGAATNTAPTTAVTSPPNNSSYPEGASITFSGTAMDREDGSLTASMQWTSSLAGQIGVGGSFSRVLAPGTHVITARVTDGGGMAGSSQISMSVTVDQPSTPSGATLTARGYKVKGQQKADLNWTGLEAASIDVYRNGSRILTTGNTGALTDSIGNKGNGSYTYKVCEAATSTCSNEASIRF